MPDTLFDVVANLEGQYSLWPCHKPMAPGWHPVGPRGDRQVCLAYIDRHWTDLRPRSLDEAPSLTSGEVNTHG